LEILGEGCGDDRAAYPPWLFSAILRTALYAGWALASVTFTPNLARHVPLHVWDVVADTVGQALAGVFEDEPRLRGYVLDERGAVRHHVAVFVDGGTLRDRQALTDTLVPDSKIHVMQALSGG